MRLLGILLLALGIAGTVRAVASAFSARRPLDLAWALLAPSALLLGIAGLVVLVLG